MRCRGVSPVRGIITAATTLRERLLTHELDTDLQFTRHHEAGTRVLLPCGAAGQSELALATSLRVRESLSLR